MYQLYHGDCLDILPTLEPQSVDAVICDPPYGITACKWDSVIPFEPMWAAIKRVLKPRGACVLFGSQPFTSALVMSNPKWYRHSWAWDKKRAPNGTLAHMQPMRAHEDILVFGIGNLRYTPQMGDWSDDEIKRMPHTGKKWTPKNELGFASSISAGRDVKLDRGKFPSSVLRIPALGSTDPERTGHPTQKPLALLEYLIKTYTNEGDAVLDFTMGSGTTGHACGNLGRRFIGIEKDAGYFAIAQERIATAYDPLRAMQVAS